MLYTHQDLAITQTETFDNDHCQLLLCTSDPSKVIISLLYRPPNIASPPSFETNSFRSLDFTKGDFVKINNRLSTVNWAELSSTCDEEEFPERVTQVLLEAC